jgi:hypothetical protein
VVIIVFAAFIWHRVREVRKQNHDDQKVSVG